MVTVLVAFSFILSAIRADLQFLHETWMGFFFPHQHGGGHPVLGRYRPSSLPKRLVYYLWAIVGIPIVVALYPFVLVGFIIRFIAITFGRSVARLGLVGVVVTVGLVWGVLAVVAYIQLQRSEFVAMAAAAIVATIASAIAVLGRDHGGRATTILVAYPAGVIAIFLPPIVAALIWDPLGDVLLPASDQLAAWILDELLFVFDLNELIRDAFDLEGVYFLAMWFGLSLVVGWLLGILVTLADKVRPRDDEPDTHRT